MKTKLFLLFALPFIIMDMEGRSGGRGGSTVGRSGSPLGAGRSGRGSGQMRRQAVQRPAYRPQQRSGQGVQWQRPITRPTQSPGRPGAGFQRPNGRPTYPSSRPGTGFQRPVTRPGVQPGRPQRPGGQPGRNGRYQQLQRKLNPNKPLKTDRNRNQQRVNQQRNFMNRRFDRYHNWYSLYRSNFPLFISLFPAAFQGAYGYYPPIAYDYQDETGSLPEPDPNYAAYAAGTMPLDFGPPMQPYPGQPPYPAYPPQGAAPYYPQDTAAWVDYGEYAQPMQEGPYSTQEGYGPPLDQYPPQYPEQYGQNQGMQQPPQTAAGSVGYAFGGNQTPEEPGKGYIRIIKPERQTTQKRPTDLLGTEDLS